MLPSSENRNVTQWLIPVFGEKKKAINQKAPRANANTEEQWLIKSLKIISLIKPHCKKAGNKGGPCGTRAHTSEEKPPRITAREHGRHTHTSKAY